MTRFQVLPERSQLWLEAQSSLHPIHGQAAGVVGEGEIRVTDGRIDLSVPPKARIELAAERLTTGNSLQDREMLQTIEAHKFPTVTAELREVTALQQPNRYRLQGDLTFHGVTRGMRAEMTATLEGDQTLLVEGECVLDMREFGVTPPRLLWVLQVYPEVKVRMRFVAERRE